MKVFFDTNIYIAQTLSRGGAERLIGATRAASWRVWTSRYVADELERVLINQFGFSPRLARAESLECIRRAHVVPDISSRHVVPDDPNDSPILRAALRAKADYLVTNDKHLLALHPYEGLSILSMRDYWTLLANHGLIPR